MITSEFILLHDDADFVSEAECISFFTKQLRTSDKEWLLNIHSNYDEPLCWSFAELERSDDDGTLITGIRIDAVRKRNFQTSFVSSEYHVQQLISDLEHQKFNVYSGGNANSNWCFTSLTITTDDARERKEFVKVVDAFLEKMNGIVVAPDIMDRNAFRSFYSLVSDVVEVEIEPNHDDE